MRRCSSRSHLVVAALLVTACGGDAMDEAEPGETASAPADDLACYIARGTTAEAQERPSPLMRTRFVVGDTEALLCYGAPSARGREIMGGLVVYGQLERIGANEPTTIHLDGPASVGGVAVGPGSYSIYAIPSADEWEIFLNSDWERWGIPIDNGVRTTEVGSFTATPEPMDEFVETLRYRWDGGELLLEWENTRVRIPVTGG
jgi:hypothetical protein